LYRFFSFFFFFLVDNLGWFRKERVNIEMLAKEKGQKLQQFQGSTHDLLRRLGVDEATAQQLSSAATSAAAQPHSHGHGHSHHHHHDGQPCNHSHGDLHHDHQLQQQNEIEGDAPIPVPKFEVGDTVIEAYISPDLEPEESAQVAESVPVTKH
jgi:hypothetical protein